MDKKLGVYALETEVLSKFIKAASHRNYRYENHVKTEEDWWELYNIVIMFGHHHDPRLTTNKLRLREYVTKTMFEGMSLWNMTRGKQQSLSYKVNRIIEALDAFVNCELAISYDWRWQKSRAKNMFDIKSLWTVSTGNGEVGCISASSEAEAIQKAGMFVLPLLGIDPKEERFNVRHKLFVSDNSLMQDYMSLSADVVAEHSSNIAEIENRISLLKERILQHNQIIEGLRSNIMVELGVHEKDQEN